MPSTFCSCTCDRTENEKALPEDGLKFVTDDEVIRIDQVPSDTVARPVKEEQDKIAKEQRQRERERKDAEAAEQRKLRKQEEQQKRIQELAQADLERQEIQKDKERVDALSQYAGHWVFYKNGSKVRSQNGNPFDDVAHISEHGILTWLNCKDQNEHTLVPESNGTVGLNLGGSHYYANLRGGFDKPFLQQLRWNDGEVWARKGPKLEEYNGAWSRAKDDSKGDPHSLTNMGDFLDGTLTWHERFGSHQKPLKFDHLPGGALHCILPQDEKPHWVIIEDDPLIPGTQRLRWSDGDLWFRDATHSGA